MTPPKKKKEIYNERQGKQSAEEGVFSEFANSTGTSPLSSPFFKILTSTTSPPIDKDTEDSNARVRRGSFSNFTAMGSDFLEKFKSNIGYEKLGQIYFRDQSEMPFNCYEKRLK